MLYGASYRAKAADRSAKVALLPGASLHTCTMSNHCDNQLPSLHIGTRLLILRAPLLNLLTQAAAEVVS